MEAQALKDLAMEALALGGIAAVDQAMVALAEDMEAQAEAMEVVLSLTLYRQAVMEAVLEADMVVPAVDMGVQAAVTGVPVAGGAVPPAADTMARLST